MAKRKDEELVDAEDFDEVFPYALRLDSGHVVILNADDFADKYGAEAIQVTQEDGMFYLKDGEWHLIPLASNKPKPGIKIVK